MSDIEKYNKPYISIIIAVRNGVNTLQRSIDSVLSQEYADKELIIIDGASTDGTVDLLNKNNKQIDYWESKPDRGLYHAWNKALEHANGEWIYFMGADDFLWNENVLKDIDRHLKKQDKNIRIVYGKVNVIGKYGEFHGQYGWPWIDVKNSFSQMMTIPHQGVFHRRDIFDNNQSFDENFKIAGDYDLLLNELKERDASFIKDVIISAMQEGGMTSNPEYTFEVLREVRMVRKKHRLNGIPWLLYYAYFKLYIRTGIKQILGKENAENIVGYIRRWRGRHRFKQRI
jgi:glycosyltransferase involved in cell wall biosynthesis